VDKTKKCDYCSRDINVHYTICPLCGGRLRDKCEQLPPVCPRCRTPLEVHMAAKEEYDLCPSCSGMWLDRGEFRGITSEYDVYRKEEVNGEYLKSPARDPVEYIPCVRCGKMMNRKNFGKISGVIIDECGRHGVWLDPGELEKIRHFIADGGLEQAQDREIEKTRMELRDLATTVDQVAFTQKIIHFWNLKRWLFGG
jgi:Zn-finger nucleic acid-binding protein